MEIIKVDPKDVELVLSHVDNVAIWPKKVWDARMRLAEAVEGVHYWSKSW